MHRNTYAAVPQLVEGAVSETADVQVRILRAVLGFTPLAEPGDASGLKPEAARRAGSNPAGGIACRRAPIGRGPSPRCWWLEVRVLSTVLQLVTASARVRGA